MPIQAISLMMIARGDEDVDKQANGVFVIDGVNVGVLVSVAEPVGDGVLVSVGVLDGVLVGVALPQVTSRSDEFCGSLGMRRKKSDKLLFESIQLPNISRCRS